MSVVYNANRHVLTCGVGWSYRIATHIWGKINFSQLSKDIYSECSGKGNHGVYPAVKIFKRSESHVLEEKLLVLTGVVEVRFACTHR